MDNRNINELLEDIRERYRDILNDDSLSTVIESVFEEVKSYSRSQENLTKKLAEIGIALSAEKNLNVLLEKIVIEAMDYTNADGGTLYIMEPDEASIAFKIMRTKSLNFEMGGTGGKEIPFPPLKLYMEDGSINEQNVSAYVAITGKTVNIPDVYEAEGFDFKGARAFDKNTGYRSQSMLVTALRNHENEIIGVLQLLNAKNKEDVTIPFSRDYQELIESLASQAAIAIVNSSLIENLENLLDSFIQVIAGAIDDKSPYTAGHVRRVAELTIDLGQAVNESQNEAWRETEFSFDEKNELRIAALMHDIGKITTPEYVVDKATKLETVHDRINTVLLRFELLKKEVEIEYLTKKAYPAKKDEDLEAMENSYKEKLDRIEKDIEFIKNVNAGGEFLKDEKIERIKEIGSHMLTINDAKQPLLSEEEIMNLSIRKGTLNSEERKIIENHVVLTKKMLGGLPWPKKLRHVPQYAGGHHEKLDGTGYPEGLTKEELPLQARIIAVADIFEALSASDRPYKEGKTLSECIKILGFMIKDNHIDSDLVDLLITSGLVCKYAGKELKDYQKDSFTYKGVEYNCPDFKKI